MPWCEPCEKYFTPSAMTTHNQCPVCGNSVQIVSLNGRIKADNLDLKVLAGVEDESLPWHFKLLVGLLILYLGWRIVQLFV